MLTINDKIEYLKEQLDAVSNNYADSFKTDILFLAEFNSLSRDFKKLPRKRPCS